jgi:hypothetical protein
MNQSYNNSGLEIQTMQRMIHESLIFVYNKEMDELVPTNNITIKQGGGIELTNMLQSYDRFR